MPGFRICWRYDISGGIRQDSDIPGKLTDELTAYREALICSGILDNGFGLAFHGEHHWPLAPSEVLHKIS